MTKKIRYTDNEGNSLEAEVYELPDTCPVCDNGIEPIPVIAFAEDFDPYNSNSILQAIFRCPVSNCSRMFFAYYRYEYGRSSYIASLSRFDIPTYTAKPIIDEIISSISPDFIAIYEQAVIAEGNNLDRICGPGYGKALEYLIKDYLIRLEPDRKEELAGMWLGQVIKEVQDANIQICALRAAWLRNDETHYVRIWNDKDLENLKELIKLTMFWIQSSEITKKYKEDMSDTSTQNPVSPPR